MSHRLRLHLLLWTAASSIMLPGCGKGGGLLYPCAR